MCMVIRNGKTLCRASLFWAKFVLVSFIAFFVFSFTQTAHVPFAFASEPNVVTFAMRAGDAERGTLAVTANGVAIESGDAVDEDAVLVFTATPAVGFSLRYWTINNSRLDSPANEGNHALSVDGESSVLTLHMDLFGTVSVTVAFDTAYTLRLEQTEHGTVSAIAKDLWERPVANGEAIFAGEQAVFTANTDEGYIVEYWFINGIRHDDASLAGKVTVGTNKITVDMSKLNGDVKATAQIVAEEGPAPEPKPLFQQILDGIKCYAKYVLLGLLAVAIIIFSALYFDRRAKKKRKARAEAEKAKSATPAPIDEETRRLEEAKREAKTVAQKFEDTKVAAGASVTAAFAMLTQAKAQMQKSRQHPDDHDLKSSAMFLLKQAKDGLHKAGQDVQKYQNLKKANEVAEATLKQLTLAIGDGHARRKRADKEAVKKKGKKKQPHAK